MDKTETYIQIRLTKFEKNRIKWLADKYANGNMSLYLIYSALNISRKEIIPEDLNGYSARKKRGPK